MTKSIMNHQPRKDEVPSHQQPSPAVPREPSIEREVRARRESRHFTDGLFLQKIRENYQHRQGAKERWLWSMPGHTHLCDGVAKDQSIRKVATIQPSCPYLSCKDYSSLSQLKGQNSAILKLLREPQGLCRRANLGITASEDRGQ